MLYQRWSSWFSALSRRDKIHALLLFIATAGVIGHQASMWFWFVEDSAISFSFARHLVEGEGLVAYRGGERVEGYSNPTWVLLLAFFYLLGGDPFFVTKVIQLVFGALTVPLVYATVRNTTGSRSDAPIVAAIFLGCNSQLAIWGAAGLENGLFNFLIALGFYRTMIEVTHGDPKRGWAIPWSAWIWLLVALTRPEGIMYSALGGFCTMLFHIHARRSPMPTIVWLLLFFVPWGLYQYWHYQYFAWPLANTYYGKLEDREPMRLAWDRKAWNWTRDFFMNTTQGFFLPIWLLGVLGDGKRRFAVATALVFVVGALIELTHDQRFLLLVVVGTLWAVFWFALRASEENPPRWLAGAATAVALLLISSAELARYFGMSPNPIPVPDALKLFPPYLFIGLALTLPLMSIGSRGWPLRVMSFLFCSAVVFFAIYVQWDWMKGFRWYATAAVPGAILFAFGVDSFVRFVEEMFGESIEENPGGFGPWSSFGVGLAVVVTLAQLPGNVYHTVKVATEPDPSPRGIKVRVDYVDEVRDRLHIEEPLIDLDVDQGAHLWWSDYEMMDIAGLIDVSFAHQKFEREFVREYVFQEKRPQYAHVHGGWAGNSKIPSHPEWRRDYIEIPGYPAGKSQLHIGNFIRRDIVLRPRWPNADSAESPSRVSLEQGLTLYPPHIPSEPGASRDLYIEVGMSFARPPQSKATAGKPKGANFRLVLFIAGQGTFASFEIPPGYDWVRPEKWETGDVFVGKFDLTLPADIEPGRYDVGFAVIGGDGRFVPPLPRDQDPSRPSGVQVGGEDIPIRFARGEVVFPGALTVLSAEEGLAAAEKDRIDALSAAQSLRCDDAEHLWWLARVHRPDEGWEDPETAEWTESHRAEMESAFAVCWSRSSDGQSQDEQVRRLSRARRWDHFNDEYLTRATVLADALYEQGLAARSSGDWETAYRRFSDAVDVDRSRSWARRYAEEARGYRLGIDPVSKARKQEEQERAKQQNDQRRKDAQERAAKAKAAKAGEKPAGEKPAGEKPAGEKPAGEKPAGEKPAQGGAP